jgi:hypothetical protein
MEREREISSLLAYPGLPTIVNGIFARLSEKDVPDFESSMT